MCIEGRTRHQGREGENDGRDRNGGGDGNENEDGNTGTRKGKWAGTGTRIERMVEENESPEI